MGNTGTMDKAVTIQTSSDCDDNYEGNITIDNSSLIGTEIQKVLPADEGPWKLFYVTPLRHHPFWKHKPLSENDTVDSVDTSRLLIRAVRHEQRFFFPHWKLQDIQKPKKMESTNMPSLKKTGVQKTPALQKEPEVDDLHGACPNNACENSSSWTCGVCETVNCHNETSRCELCGEPETGSMEAQRQALQRGKIYDDIQTRMEQERRRLEPAPICLCGHSMLMASDRIAPMRCPSDAHAETERATMVKFDVYKHRDSFITCHVCQKFIDDDFAWCCGGCNSSHDGDRITNRGCGFLCCDDCKKTRASRWNCMQCGQYRGQRSGMLRVTSKRAISVQHTPKYPGVSTNERVLSGRIEKFSNVRLVSGPRKVLSGRVSYLYLYEIGPGRWVHDFSPDDPDNRSITVVSGKDCRSCS